MPLTNLDGLKKLYGKMAGKTSTATNIAEAIDEIAGAYGGSAGGSEGATVSCTGISGSENSFVSDTSLTYTANIALGEINQLYVISRAGTTMSTVFKATGSGYDRTGTLWLPIIYTDSSDREVADWFEYTATSKLVLNSQGKGSVVTTFSPKGSPSVNSDRVAMKFVNVRTDSFDIEV